MGQALGIYANFAEMSVIGEVEGIEKICAALFILSGAFAIFKFIKDAKTPSEGNDLELETSSSNS